ncbi:MULTISPECIES: SDR family NAD(P)-dependent oxidoreductase [unclassified Aeromicrobium]|uniref:SDR family NAD(P)-dependent oxidoreductase n=1 Tax=unclassified Aeromicrobium TaxID=2633570 RepID=UPI00396B3F8A
MNHVLITGAASGIGRQLARRLAADAVRTGEPARLALLDRDTKGLEAVVKELNGEAAEARAFEVDLAIPASVDQAATDAIAWLGALDSVVSNAGIILSGPLTELSVEDWDLAFNVNTRAAWLLGRVCHDSLAEGGGSMVIVASLAATAATGGMGAYSPSKAAVRMLSIQLAREWGGDGIRVNCVSPGSTATGLTSNIFADSAVREARAATIPLGRIGEPEDVADVIAFLIGPDARFVTGADVAVDGGWGAALVPGGIGVSPVGDVAR